MELIFPTYNFNVKKVENRNYIFDIIRKKYVVLTPEEWVRQHLVQYFIQECQCSAALIAVEKGFMVNGLQKRFDVLVFNKSGKPILLAECKAPNISINDSTFAQASIYNKTLRVKHLVITNGMALAMCSYSDDFNDYTIRDYLPPFPFDD
jgi:hypothetical protein